LYIIHTAANNSNLVDKALMEKDFTFPASIEKPSRYLGSEINAILKDPNQVKLRMALAFPDLYEIGTSHFGLQILYHILNSRPEVAAERVFAPAVDLEGLLRKTGKPLFSLESHTPIYRFDIIGFSLLYELNYTNMLTMLELSGIPWLAAERDSRHPFVIAGGPCTCNPEPLAEFFDAMVVGDGETVVLELVGAWLAWKQAGARHRQDLLERWCAIEGVYIPAFFEAHYDDLGFQTVVPKLKNHMTVRRAMAGDLDAAPFPDRPVVPFGKPVHDRLRIEVSRGCTRGCRFCQAGMLYRPVRERSPEGVLDLAERALRATGYEDLSLLSLSTGDYGCILPLMQRLMDRYASQRVAVSLPSLRAGTLSPEIMDLIRQVRKTGFTIAPEAGSQRLRDVINKNISEPEIVETVRDAFQMGWQLVKLYFMIGLPTETLDDIEALVDLVQGLRKLKGPRGRRGQLNVSVATFIPKPHTPFQWAAQLVLAESRERLRWIQERLKPAGIEFKWQNPEMSFLEGVWARGDRRIGAVLRAAHRRGCRFDGWGDKFNFGAWMAAFDEEGVDPDFYLTRHRDTHEPLPWDHIDILVGKGFLRSEWEKALAAGLTADCRFGGCNACGVCDFEAVAPRVHTHMALQGGAPVASSAFQPAAYRKLQLSYAKLGPARFFGHLELVNIFLRALRRAGIPVKFSEGFHPKPKVAFDNPLPTGMESEAERMVVTVASEVAPAALLRRLNAELPEGLHVHTCSEDITAPPDRCTFRISFGRHLPELLKPFLNDVDYDRELVVSSPKGKLKKIVLRDILIDIREAGPTSLDLVLGCDPAKRVRPAEVLRQGFGFSREVLAQAGIRKLKAQPVSLGQ
jgi:radical SAM family uncharacterized protein/radical SAM-linked protein